MATSKVVSINRQEDVIEGLLSNNQSVIRQLYVKNYPKIEALILKNNGNTQDAKDIYQEAFIALWKKVRSQSFELKNESAVDGFLYQVSKNKWMDHLRSAGYKKNVSYDLLTESGVEKIPEGVLDTAQEENKKLKQVLEAYKHLGYECKALLKKFYYEKQSMNDIASELLLDPASCRNKKYRCMQKLRELTLKNQ